MPSARVTFQSSAIESAVFGPSALVSRPYYKWQFSGLISGSLFVLFEKSDRGAIIFQSHRVWDIWPKSQVWSSYCFPLTLPWYRVKTWEHNSMPSCHDSLCDLPSVHLDPIHWLIWVLFSFGFHACWFCQWRLLCAVASVWLAMGHHVCHSAFIMASHFPWSWFCGCGVLDWTSRLNDLRVHAFSLHFNYTIWL